jgi:hypothetical protein
MISVFPRNRRNPSPHVALGCQNNSGEEIFAKTFLEKNFAKAIKQVRLSTVSSCAIFGKRTVG